MERCAPCNDEAVEEAVEEAEEAVGENEAVDKNEERVFGIRQAPSGKWLGQVGDTVHSAMNPGGKQKQRYTPSFSTRSEAVKALAELRAKVEEEFETIVLARVEADPLVKDLPRAPEDISNAELKKAYWVCTNKTNFVPRRMVRMNGGKGGLKWKQACIYCNVNDASMAQMDKRLVALHPSCTAHGGVCDHGRNPSSCRQCNEDSNKHIVSLCSHCKQTRLNRKRQITAGGSGLCPLCEAHLNTEAAESGAEPPEKGKRWEDVVLDQLVTMVVDPVGNVIAYEMRDDMSNMLGSNKRRRHGECSTEHQRRPDILWLVREPEDSRIVAAVMIEVDENSHSDRESVCEGGKVHDTFQSILKLAQEEGKGRLGEVRKGEVLTPQVVFIRFNPNACDDPGGAIRLATRIQVLASRVCELLNTPADVYQQRSRDGQCMKPHLEILYYHSKEGGKHLAFYEQNKHAFHLTSNRCPRV